MGFLTTPIGCLLLVLFCTTLFSINIVQALNVRKIKHGLTLETRHDRLMKNTGDVAEFSLVSLIFVSFFC